MNLEETLIRFICSFFFAIAILYGAFFYLKKNPGLLTFTKNRIPLKQSLQIESVLALEARKNLYVVRSGKERFLLATSLEGTQFLSRLHEEEPGLETESALPSSGTLEKDSTQPVSIESNSAAEVNQFKQQSFKFLPWLYQRFGDVIHLSQGSFHRLRLKESATGVLRREVTAQWNK